MKVARHYRWRGRSYEVRVAREGDKYVVAIEAGEHPLRLVRSSGREVVVSVDRRQVRGYVLVEGDRLWVAYGGRVYLLEGGEEAVRRSHHPAGEADLSAAMPGQVVKVLVQPGQEVKKGQTLVILEAMKMEIKLTAPYVGRVTKLHCAEGQVVQRGQQLVEIAPSNP